MVQRIVRLSKFLDHCHHIVLHDFIYLFWCKLFTCIWATQRVPTADETFSTHEPELTGLCCIKCTFYTLLCWHLWCMLHLFAVCRYLAFLFWRGRLRSGGEEMPSLCATVRERLCSSRASGKILYCSLGLIWCSLNWCVARYVSANCHCWCKLCFSLWLVFAVWVYVHVCCEMYTEN